MAEHLTKSVRVAWDKAGAQEDEGIEGVPRGAAGRLVPLYPPTYSPWLNQIEILWRQFRREITHLEQFAGIDVPVKAAQAFLDRYNCTSGGVRSSIGANFT